ncbi:hypothetical protein TWF106_001427 [Orbilia oligospora]|uniref:Uncharacterized protein n=1 Tax=Orbilia oligospora TaxID=2813651 RepID=A0A6G1MAB4_ORBOL|nr:hypothetical protein TWF106_001427 [Orbilia oligospora]KAF3214437.1 hypothetical protein TWF679_004811 [Orbilia oligospora]KAF3230556.1 hypothetical protein TWF191_009471 [Orbilia oligospora]KAF3249075.1 hypothetical protein TWF192_006023 [Orbilia oligospora]
MPRCYKISDYDLRVNFVTRQKIARSAYAGALTVWGDPKFYKSLVLLSKYRGLRRKSRLATGPTTFLPKSQLCFGSEILKYPIIDLGEVDAEFVWDSVDATGFKPPFLSIVRSRAPRG